MGAGTGAPSLVRWPVRRLSSFCLHTEVHTSSLVSSLLPPGIHWLETELKHSSQDSNLCSSVGQGHCQQQLRPLHPMLTLTIGLL